MAAKSLVSLVSLALLFSSAFAASLGDATVETAEAAAQLQDAQAPPRNCPKYNTTVEPGICSECKASPHTLALNVKAYDYNEAVTLVATAKGQSINCDKTWFKTSDGCWVTQWDVTVNDANATSKLCKTYAPGLDITTQWATTKYKAECYDNGFRATEGDQRKRMFKENSDVAVICKLADFFKTTDDCFIEAQMLDGPEDPDDLPNCGPQVLLREPKMRQPDAEDKSCPTKTKPSSSAPTDASDYDKSKPIVPSTTSPKAVARAEGVHTSPALPEPSTHYLVNTTIGEEYAPCLRCPKPECKPKKIYKFGTTVTIQCYTGTYLLTTEFCYLNNTLVDYQVTSESYLYPSCASFTDEGH